MGAPVGRLTRRLEPACTAVLSGFAKFIIYFIIMFYAD